MAALDVGASDAGSGVGAAGQTLVPFAARAGISLCLCSQPLKLREGIQRSADEVLRPKGAIRSSSLIFCIPQAAEFHSHLH